ncbi:hypothetical protein RCC89_17135 [Cytophagaceae bacterium ABcell3]|nr:hypothetical protein RCC89_17135 [Cytophagaceae bacterium ABcell3]
MVFRRVDDEHTECTNEDVVAEISRIQLDPDTDYGYRSLLAIVLQLLVKAEDSYKSKGWLS